MIFNRQQARISIQQALAAGFASSVTIAALLLMSSSSNYPWLMAPFGASCVLIFTAPESPLSQPVNVIGGHLLASAIGLISLMLLGSGALSIVVATGAAVMMMRWLRVTHPPAGANPMVVIASQPGWQFLIFPVLSGALVLLAAAIIYQQIITRRYST